MTAYERQYSAAMDELFAAGVSRSNASPPLLRLLRHLGARPRPFPYMPFWRVMLVMAAWFGPTWGGFMWLMIWHVQGLSLWFAIVTSMAAGLAFGALMAAYEAILRRRHSLSQWDAL